MSGDILLRTVRDIARRIAAEPGADGWPEIARLYCAAVEQMASIPARAPERPLPPHATGAIAAADWCAALPATSLRHLCESVEMAAAQAGARECADIGAQLVEELGKPLYRRLVQRLGDVDAHGADAEPDALFRVEIGDRRWLLVLGCFAPEGEPGSFGADWLEMLPADGYDPRRAKVIPPWVRPIPFSDAPPSIQYLDLIGATADRALGGMPAGDGLRLAAIPLHPDLAFVPEAQSTDRDGHTVFRMKEPHTWPAEWETHLRDQIRRASAARVAVASLPELCASPAVVAVARDALARCGNGFPTLLCLGSWHEDEGAAFRNRLTVLTRGHRGVDVVLVHDKFEPFVDGGHAEGHEPGPRGLTFLVTRAGLLAFGVCKDWYLHRATHGPMAATQLDHLCPTLAVCPMMTRNLDDIGQMVATKFKGTRTVLLGVNACGTMRGLGLVTRCLAMSDARRVDIRSVVAAASDHFEVAALGGEPASAGAGGGVARMHAPCCADAAGCGAASANTVFARVCPKRP